MAKACLSGENLFDRLGKSQAIIRQILRHAVVLMVLRLGPRFPSASFRGLLYPIIQQVVVERKIGGIDTHAEYERLRKNGVDADVALLQKFRKRPRKRRRRCVTK